MSRVASPELVERLDRATEEETEPELSKHAGVVEVNRAAREELPEWQQIEGDWWRDDDDLTHGERQRMTDRERQVWRSVKIHGMRLRDLAEHPRGFDADASTLRSVLRSAESKRGVQR